MNFCQAIGIVFGAHSQPATQNTPLQRAARLSMLAVMVLSWEVCPRIAPKTLL